jgi:hypothetical protein
VRRHCPRTEGAPPAGTWLGSGWPHLPRIPSSRRLLRFLLTQAKLFNHSGHIRHFKHFKHTSTDFRREAHLRRSSQRARSGSAGARAGSAVTGASRRRGAWSRPPLRAAPVWSPLQSGLHPSLPCGLHPAQSGLLAARRFLLDCDCAMQPRSGWAFEASMFTCMSMLMPCCPPASMHAAVLISAELHCILNLVCILSYYRITIRYTRRY